MNLALFLISGCILASFALLPLARRSGAPLLLILLVVGMLLGEDGPGGIEFDNFSLAFNIGSVALAVILFAGGIETERGVLKIAKYPAILLSTLGVIITAAVVGGAVHFILGISLMIALLLGAVVASTDAAATFLLIQQSGVPLRERVKQTLVLESGLNDPVAIFLTIVLTTFVGAAAVFNSATLSHMGLLLAAQVAFGLFGGVLGGRVLVFLMERLELPEGTYPSVAVAGALTIYSGTSLIGGSGFLAAYIVGIIVRNKLTRPLDRIANFSEGLQWLSQMVLFLMLGLLVTPSELPGEFLPAMICAGVLMFIARPIAVFLSVGFMGFSIKELTFLSWVGLRGGVPILLAIYPIVSPGPVDTQFFNIVFIIVASSLVLQGWTIVPLAKFLKLGSDIAAD